MCFLEYIAYTCGHCSPGVVRPCPLTTARHTNHVCAHKALRQFPSPGMCPNCERIIHSRSVISLEWEHRFMHERGLCGCEVIFPGLTGPRNAGALNGVAEEEFQAQRAVTRNGRSEMDGNIAPAPPIFQTIDRPHEDLRINVRIPSLYSVEWLDDHRQLHRECKCDCGVDFEQYDTRLALPTPAAGPTNQGNVVDSRNLANRNGRTVSVFPNRASGFSSASDLPNGDMASARTVSQTTASSSSAHNDPRVKRKGSVADDTVIRGPIVGSHGQLSVATARLLDQSTSQSTVAYPYSSMPESIWHHLVGTEEPDRKVSDTFEPQGRPYAGLPLGAGPEGERHAVDFNWDTCRLARRTHLRALSLS